jgi:hypothetical protein
VRNFGPKRRAVPTVGGRDDAVGEIWPLEQVLWGTCRAGSC